MLPITVLPGYNDPENYTDGASEDKLLDLFQTTQPEEYEQRIQTILNNAPSWAERVHLSQQRHHLLDWFDFESEAKLLEVGAGCGALTELFAKRVAQVDALEPSKKRATILAYRHQLRENVRVLVGDLAAVAEQAQRYNYVALVGVLEYSGLAQSSQQLTSADPWLRLLQQAAAVLERDGILLLAIENQLGIKYIAGYAEDHYGEAMAGIEDYLMDKGVRTFAKPELQSKLNQAGFVAEDWYYPFPDYKLPTSVYSDLMPPGSVEPTSIMYPTVDFAYPSANIFAESRFARILHRNGLSSLFANSFLVVCKKI